MKKLLIIYTGNGEGKTSAAFGHVVRALGYNKKCVVIKFLKKRKSGEDFLQEAFPELVKIYHFGKKRFVKKTSKKYRELIKNALCFAGEICKKEKPFLLVLDEINVAINLGLVGESEVIKLLEKIKARVVILTGRGRCKRIEKLANIVTEMRDIKHDFPKRKATKGVEY